MQELTKRQRAVFEYIRSSISERGFPPTVAEIQSEFSFASPTSAVDHLRALSKKGFIRVHRGVSRGIELLRGAAAGMPLVGDIAAGSPALAVENIVEVLDIDAKLFSPQPDFALRVKGDSMIGAGINDGDIASRIRKSFHNAFTEASSATVTNATFPSNGKLMISSPLGIKVYFRRKAIS